jgi:hypothetical protein
MSDERDGNCGAAGSGAGREDQPEGPKRTVVSGSDEGEQRPSVDEQHHHETP